jgi:UDP-N-acetylglucosamine 2-epimerase
VKIVTVVGARPQFIKAAVVSKAIKTHAALDERLVHTGQHYDERMSQVFFDELDIPRPAYNLHVGSASHGKQTGEMLCKLEALLLEERPGMVLVYGDTNSTLAGALAAAKLNIPVAHVEAGLRSYSRQMAEEINRVLTDHASRLLFCPTTVAVENLAAEGIRDDVELVGDVMYDASMYFGRIADSYSKRLASYGLTRHNYVLMTCHRAENTDNPRRLRAIINAANKLADRQPVLFPVHPRTRNRLRQLDVSFNPQLHLAEPLSYLEMLAVERGASLILTDSGGVQKEAFFCGVPCVTMREETEWSETVDSGSNILAGADEDQILSAARSQLERTQPIPAAASYYGDGLASERVAEQLANFGRNGSPRERDGRRSPFVAANT